MIDLHLHTIFSDGDISDMERIVEYCDTIAITDHNSIQACGFFQNAMQGKNMIIGCEVTVDQAPDYLLYFPNGGPLKKIEHELETIRMAEEEVIKECYFRLGYQKWDTDIARAFPQKQRIKNARTRDLAAIIHLYKHDMDYNNGAFDLKDLEIARKQRREYAEIYGNPIHEDAAFRLAKRYGGQIVLAHPIRTAIRRCPKEITVASVEEQLLALMKCYACKGGKSIEWEYFSVPYMEKYRLTLSDIDTIRTTVWVNALKYGFLFTLGSDSHSLDDYAAAAKWLTETETAIRSRLVEWVR